MGGSKDLIQMMDPRIHRQSLGDLLRRTAARMPDKVAIRCGTTAWTYAEFDRLCTRLAAGFSAHGVGLGDRVAVLARNSHAFAAVRFAIARLGAVLVPINFMLNGAEIAYILRHAGVKLLCVDTALAPTAQQAAELGTVVEQFVWLPSEEPTAAPEGWTTFDDLLRVDAPLPQPQFDGRHVAQIIYTSGTESLPKGAVLSHDALIWQYVTCLVDAEIAADDRILHALPLYHCAQLDAFLGPGVYVGATNVITAHPTPEHILPLIEQHNINSFFSPPTVWISLMRSPLFDSSSVSSLRKGYYGASIMPRETLREIATRFHGLRLWNLYGQTEIAPVATILKPEQHAGNPGSAGIPGLNVETCVVDDACNPVPAGQIGEIVHRSPQLISEYYGDPERTAAAFAGGWFHSGDLGVIDENGFLSVVDRKKDVIKTGGENVASREVEEVIYRLPAVSEVAVFGVPHERWVEAIIAVILVRSGHAAAEQEVIEHCRVNMAHFKVPKRVLFAESLPKSPSGKILKRELRLRYAKLMSG
jgi:fatty-acyl-CoA synthase